MRSAYGVVGVALFNAKKGFPDNSSMAIEGRSVPAGKSCKVIFENVPRIANRGRHLLDQIQSLLQRYTVTIEGRE